MSRRTGEATLPRAAWATLRAVGVALLAASLLATAAAAQPRIGAGLAGGPSFPLEALNRSAATGFHVAPHVALVGARLELRAEALFESFARDGGGALDGIGVIASAILPVGAARRSYLVAGAGVLQVDPGAGETGSEFTFGVGAGTRVSRFFLEFRYLDSGEGARSVPVTFGLRLR